MVETAERVRELLDEAFAALVSDDILRARRALRAALRLDPEHRLAREMLRDIEPDGFDGARGGGGGAAQPPAH